MATVKPYIGVDYSNFYSRDAAYDNDRSTYAYTNDSGNDSACTYQWSGSGPTLNDGKLRIKFEAYLAGAASEAKLEFSINGGLNYSTILDVPVGSYTCMDEYTTINWYTIPNGTASGDLELRITTTSVPPHDDVWFKVYDIYVEYSLSSASHTPSRSPSHTESSTPSSTPSPSHTPSHTPSPSFTPSHTSSPSFTPSHTPSHSISYTPSRTPSHTQSPSHTISLSRSMTPSPTPSATPSAGRTAIAHYLRQLMAGG